MEAFSKYETAAKFTRERLGVSRLTLEQKAEVEAAVARHQQRAERRVATIQSSETSVERIRRTLWYETHARVESLILRLYRQASSSWAGGKTFVTVREGVEPAASGVSSRAWSSNGKWSGSNAVLDVTISPKWRQQVAPVAGLADAGGMLTTHAVQVSDDCWQASWVCQSRGFGLKVESGYIVRCGDEWLHGKTEAAARSVLKRRQAAAQQEQVKESFAALLRTLDAPTIAAQYGQVVVKRSDSLKAGNCESGTDNWIERHFPQADQATVAEILAVDSSDYVLRSVRAAVLRSVRRPVAV